MVLNYIGSKLSLLPFLEEVLLNHIPLPIQTFADLFSGTCSVSSYFYHKYHWKIINNDAEYYSYVIAQAMLNAAYTPKLQYWIDQLNQLEGAEGLVLQHYSPKAKRMFFTLENAKKIDAMRMKIEELFRNQLINQNEYYFLLASLLECSDKVANVSCVYGAFLKTFKRSSLRSIQLVPIHQYTVESVNVIYQQDVLTLLNQPFKADVVYLDPPYNQRQYSANYFVLNYIAEYRDVELKGITGIPTQYFKSDFCSKVKVEESFHTLLQNLSSRYILISYNNEGLLSLSTFQTLCSKYGTVKTFVKRYKKFKAQKEVEGNTTFEYLHLIDTQNTDKTIETIEV